MLDDCLTGQYLLTHQAVVRELYLPNIQSHVQNWMARRPAWIEIKAASVIDPAINLGAGETEAIS
jgi:hypothetical protein